jgi:hypothetical protein
MTSPIEISDDSHKDERHTIILAQLARLDGAIEKEFTLVSDRMVWMVISQSFIFGAFTTAIVNYADDKPLKYAVLALIAALPVLGILIAHLVHRAIKAAHTAADRLKVRREQLEERFAKPLRVNLVSSRLETHAAGNIPSRLLPPFIISAWVVLLLVAVVQLLLARTAAAVATATLLAVFLGLVLYLIRRSALARVEDLERRVRLLETTRLSDSAGGTGDLPTGVPGR